MPSLCTWYPIKLFAGAVALLIVASGEPLKAKNLLGAYDPTSEVDVELVLAVDISQSMDVDEQEVQRAGYVAALTSNEVIEAIHYGPLGRVAITYVEWGGLGEQFVIADWAVVEDRASAEAFAALIAEAPLQHRQRTSIASALSGAVTMIQTNRFQGMRRVIDVSGDGPNNQGGAVTVSRDAAMAAGITINGLPLMMKTEQNAWQAFLHLDDYYEDCVIGGPGAFAIPVRSKEGFADAIRMKLVLEIAGLQPQAAQPIQVAGRTPVNCKLFD